MEGKMRIIRTDEEHEAAVREIERLWSAEPGTPDHDNLELLGYLVNAYEEKRWPIEQPDPIVAIKFRMEQAGYTSADLGRVIGSEPRASEVLRKKRALNVKMIHAISSAWRIPAEVLITPYQLSRT